MTDYERAKLLLPDGVVSRADLAVLDEAQIPYETRRTPLPGGVVNYHVVLWSGGPFWAQTRWGPGWSEDD